MRTKLEECILYRNFAEEDVLHDIASLLWRLNDEAFTSFVPLGAQGNLHHSDEDSYWEDRSAYFRGIAALVEMAGSYGFEGNLWHDYLTLLLVNHENAFSKACEIRGRVPGRLWQSMIFRFLRNCLIFLFPFWIQLSIQTAEKPSAHFRMQMYPEGCLTDVFGTESENYLPPLPTHRIRQLLPKP